ncbi:hypothetical protein LX36DRAFT_711032 [Colletotrichum falcatum]|nr:hypothetical protein LX36DRAFT_711032 [Colletotrichum falcatum]
MKPLLDPRPVRRRRPPDARSRRRGGATRDLLAEVKDYVPNPSGTGTWLYVPRNLAARPASTGAAAAPRPTTRTPPRGEQRRQTFLRNGVTHSIDVFAEEDLKWFGLLVRRAPREEFVPGRSERTWP